MWGERETGGDKVVETETGGETNRWRESRRERQVGRT